MSILQIIRTIDKAHLLAAKSLYFVYRGSQIVGVYITYRSGRRIYKSLKRRRSRGR